MCGLCGEFRWDGKAADTAAVARMTEPLAPRGPNGTGSARRGLDRARPPPADDHRPVRARRAADGRLRARACRSCSTAASTTTGSCATSWRRVGLPVLLHTPTPRCCSRPTTAGARAASSTSRACSRSRSPSATPACSTLGRDRLGIKPLYLAETPGRLRFASHPAGAAGRRRRRHLDRPVALHHYMSFHSVVPAPRTILAGVRKLPPATVRVDRARRHAMTERVVLAPDFTPRPGPRRWTRARLAGRGAGVAAGRGARAAWSPTCRSGCCCPAASTRRWSWRCSPRRARTG